MKRVTTILILLFILLLSLPLIQMRFEPVELKPLKGYFHKKEKPVLTINSWLDATFQQTTEEYFKDNLGFRPFLIRLRNQILYSFYRQSKVNKGIRGTDDYLFEASYLNAYTGLDYIGADSIKARTERIKKVQDYLSNQNKTLLICLAAGKGSFYPEYFPEKYKNKETDSTNYLQYAKSLKENQVNVIDFNDWFLKMKDTSTYMLYPKYGIHWSQFGVILAADSIVRYFENKCAIDMPNLRIKDYTLSNKPLRTDYDLGNAMNLLCKLKSPTMCYPNTYWETNDSLKTSPRALVIADSFFWQMFNLGMLSKSFSLGSFWYYNKQAYPKRPKIQRFEDIDLLKELENTDVVIVMATESTLPKMGWGFFEEAIFLKK